MNKYSAKLLFQFRTDLGQGKSDIVRRCEERIVMFSARDAKGALRKAKAHGRTSQYKGWLNEGKPVHFEFIGIMDLLEIGIECAKDEVWYDITRRKLPMERKGQILPAESKLNAIMWECRKKRHV